MSEKGMIFTAESIQAILGGRKSQTRRVVEPQPEQCTFELYHKCGSDKFHYDETAQSIYCQVCGRPLYYDKHLKKRTVKKRYEAPCNVGDIIYVKEACALIDFKNGGKKYWYRADISEHLQKTGDEIISWRSPMYMPKAAARIFLRVTGVRVERLNVIAAEDCYTEGYQDSEGQEPRPRSWYSEHWDEINGNRDKGAYKWDNNPWVWVYDFERLRDYERKNKI